MHKTSWLPPSELLSGSQDPGYEIANLGSIELSLASPYLQFLLAFCLGTSATSNYGLQFLCHFDLLDAFLLMTALLTGFCVVL